MAKRLGDEQGINRFNQLIKGRQARLRQLIKGNDFLVRDYSREQIRS